MTGGTLSFVEFEQPAAVASVDQSSRVWSAPCGGTADCRHAGKSMRSMIIVFFNEFPG
jgi:hypothetical protein